MNFGLKFVAHPTPEAIKSAADSLLYGIGGCGGAVSVAADHPKLGLALLIFGMLAKAVSNFFGSTNQQ